MLAITNAKIYTVTNGVIEQGSILMQDGKITAIGSQVSIPSGAQVVDAKGLVVTPGLIDAHSHVGGWEEGLGWEGNDINEFTDPITPHLNILDGINPADIGFADARKGGVTTVQTMPGSGNVIGGLMVVMKTYGYITDDMIIRNPSGMKAALGENPKRNYGSQRKMPSTRMGTAALLRENLLKACEYNKKLAQGETAKGFKEDMKLEGLARVIRREIPLRIHCHRADDIMTALRIAEEFGIDISLEHCTEGHKVAGKIAERNVPACVGPSLWQRAKIETRDISPTTPAALAAAGGKVAIITDHNIVPQHYFRIAAGLALREGLSYEDTMQAVTINAAEIIGVADRVGSLEIGKDADIVLWSGDPFEPMTYCELTVIDGKIVYQREQEVGN